MTVAVFAVLEPLVFLIAEPLVYRRTVGVSDVGLLISVAFWTWLWGGVGLVLAVPMTVCVVVLGKYIPGLEFMAILMGDESAMPADVAFYQRLLAGDADEASDLLEQARAERAPERVFDEVVMPALSYARRDRAAGLIDDDDQSQVVRTARELVDALSVSDRPGARTGTVRVVGCSARDAMDDVAFMMLGQLLASSGWELELASAELLTSEVVALVEERGDLLVCVGGVGPGGVTHTRYLVKRIRMRFPDVRIVAAHWAAPGLIERDLHGLGAAGADAIATSITESRDLLASLGTGTQGSGRFFASRAAA
jgi:hypothetical protein